MRNTEPLGCLFFAREYLKAARLVQTPPPSELEALRQRISLPGYFLLGHSIELALKAFLLGRGMTVTELRGRKYGHDLSALLAVASRRQLGREVKLKSSEAKAILLLNECYAAKELEYAFTGLRRFPSYALLHQVAEKLSTGLQSYVNRIAA